ALNGIENCIYRTAFKLRSVQTLCQLDLIDSSQIQHVLLRQSFWEARERSLSVQQLLQALQELFQRAREQNPGQVHPRASELTLSLLITMYDSTGTGFLQLAPAAAALIALSGDSPLTKYRALFQLYAEHSRRGCDSGARMTRKVLRNLLTDLQQYRCLKCLNFDICQVCFLSGLHSKSHQKSHPVIEHCIQMSAKENTKRLLRTLRNNLLQGRCRWKEATRRQWLLGQVNPKDMANHTQARLLKKQLNQCKDKLQVIHTAQEERSCRFETKIRKLTTNQNSIWTKLQQMGQDFQAMLQPLHPSSSTCQNMVSKVDHSSAERFWKGGDSFQIKNSTGGSSKWEPLPNPTKVDGSHRSQANAERALPNSESPETNLQSTRAQSQAHKMPKEILSSLFIYQEGLLQDTPQMAPAEMSSAALAPTERKDTGNIEERKNELEEEELQELLSKLMDAFNLEMPSGPQPSVNTDLYRGAERVCRAFSALVDQITLPSWK
uniref:Dystrotelin n=1 Tax=Propithecus coquereli TaxID=379532 RepID=A0A2K6FRB2_PROCO